MKIVCDACSAKYSIADDKVKGKVFKIRCKKCSNIIVVRGTAGAGGADEPAPAQFDQKDTRVYDYGYDDAGAPAGAAAPAGADADAVWHVVVDQEQVGPLTVGEVQEKFASGQVDADTYVWREGFADWQPLATVDAFAHFASGGGGGGSSGADAVSSMFGAAGGDDGGTVRSNPDDLFAARSGATAQRDDDGDSGDLFGARSAPAAAASTPRAEAGGGGAKLRGERNENSVLFSLGNLAALASDAPRASASSSSSSSSSSSGGGAAQHGGGEGSGLIDIRSMASAYLGDKPGAAKKQQSNVGSIDDLPVFSSAAFSEPAVIMPGPVHRQSNKTMMMLIGGVAALAVITLGLVVFIVLGDKKEAAPPPAVAAGETKTGGDKAVDTAAKTGDTPADKTGGPSDTGAGTGGGDTAGTGATTTAGAGTPGDDDKQPAAGTPAEDDKKSDSKKSDSKKSDSKRDDKRSSSSSSDKKTEEKKPDPAPSSGGCMDEVGCLLADKPPSCCSKYSKGKKTTEKKPVESGGGGGGGGDLPESLDSDMVKDGVGKVKSKIFACGDKYPSAKGTLKLSVKVSASGSVTGVDVVNTPDAGLGSCAASAMKGAKFGKTQRGGSFKYPFNF